MQRVTEIIGSIFIVIGQFIKTFTVELFQAIYFRALEFDSEMQLTKTPVQRIAIWSGITVAAFIGIALFLNLLYFFLSNLDFVLPEAARRET